MAFSLKHLVIVYLIVVMAKLILVSLIQTPTIFADEYIYAKNARSFYYEQTFHTHGDRSLSYPPLYSIVLSLGYLFTNMEIVYFMMKLLNVMLTSLVIFPFFFLACDFVDDKKALVTSLLLSLLPPFIVYPAYLMSENLFFPLFIFFIYVLYRSYTHYHWRYVLLTGVASGLLVLTRAMGLITFFIIGGCILYDLLQKDSNAAMSKIGALLIGGFLGSLLLVANMLASSSSLAHYQKYSLLQSLSYMLPHKILFWGVAYAGYLILATGLIPILIIGSSSIRSHRSFRHLFLISSISVVVAGALATYYSARQTLMKATILFFDVPGRVIGRYIEYVIPLLLLICCVYLFHPSLKKKRISHTAIVMSLILLVATQLVFFGLYPFNNTSLSYVGLLYAAFTKFISSDLLVVSLFFGGIFLLCVLSATYLITSYKKTTIFILLLVFVVANSFLGYAMTYYNANFLWGHSEQVQLGKWMNEHLDQEGMVLVDSEYCTLQNLKESEEALCSLGGKFVKAGFWINHDIKVDDVNTPGVDYILTKKELPYTLLQETASGIRVYHKSRSLSR